jgi:hypothetical protein
MISLNTAAWVVLAGILIAFVRATRTPACRKAWNVNRFDALALTALALIAVSIFGWMARSYFLADDFILLGQARAPWSWRAVFATRGGDGSFRPLGYLSYVASAKWAGTDPAVWHWIGFVLHIGNTILLYAVAALLGYSRFLAWLAAALFAVHGTHPEAAVWMAGRFDLLSTFFFLAALVCFLQSLKADRGRKTWLVAALIAMTAGLLSKEPAYSFALVAALLVVCTGAARRRQAWVAVLIFVAVTAALFIYRWQLLGGIGGYGQMSLLLSLKGLLFRMWAILFFPVNWTLPAGRWVELLLAAYSAALVRLFLSRAQLRRIAFAAGFVILSAAPAVSQLLIGTDLEKARVLYLPSAGFCLLLAAMGEPLRLPSQATVAAILLVFHGAMLEHNLQGWQRASEVVQSACNQAAKCAMASGARPLVTGLPRTLRGVYTFANGFPECVAMQMGEGAARASGDGACKFTWDADSASLKAVE